MRKIGVITTGRCDYSIYFPILKEILKTDNLDLILYVTGMHLSSRFGNTVNVIRKDGFTQIEEIPVDFSCDSPLAITKAMGDITSGFGKAFNKQKPDILLVLGDRFEMHAAAISAIPFRIPIAHIHGGELTYGAFDEYFRHSLTKLSSIHFASTSEYADRIKQMGEIKESVFVSGAPGLDNILNSSNFTKEELEKKFNINFSKPVILTTFHPVTTEYENTREYVLSLLDALSEFKNCNIVFTSSNADTGSAIITEEIKSFVDKHTEAFYIENFGRKAYLSMMEYAAVMVGTSSSGIIEAASFGLPVVNIGTRQGGRIREKNVVDVGYKPEEIAKGIKEAISEDFSTSLEDLKNPYGDGKASERIVSTLKNIDLKKLRAKHFCDLHKEKAEVIK